MAVNILSLGTFLLLDVSLTFGEADISVLATHQVLIQIYNMVYAMCCLDSLQQQLIFPFLFSRTGSNNIYRKCPKRKSIKLQHDFSMRTSFVLGYGGAVIGYVKVGLHNRNQFDLY